MAKKTKSADTIKLIGGGVLAILLLAAIVAASVGIASVFWKTKLPEGTNAAVRDTPGKWFYNASEGAVFEEEPSIQNGKLSVTAEDWGTDYFYFRYMPGDKEDLTVGDAFTVTFTAKLSVDGDMVYRYGNDSVSIQEAKLTADKEQTFTLTGCVLTENSGPFYVGLPDTTAAGATFEVWDVEFEKVEV